VDAAIREAMYVASGFVRLINNAHQLVLRLKAVWTDSGRKRAQDFFYDNPLFSNIVITEIVIKAWQACSDAGEDPNKGRKLYFCRQLQDVNDIFKLHPTHRKIMFLGACRELGIIPGDVDDRQSAQRLYEGGLWPKDLALPDMAA